MENTKINNKERFSFKNNAELLNSIFKGYIELPTGKIPKKGVSWKKEENLISLNEAISKNGFAGIPKSGYLVIDTDNDEDSKCMIRLVKAFGWKTLVFKTTKGYHFYFKDSKKQITSALDKYNILGFKSDFKGNEGGYLALKVDGEERKIIAIPQDNEIDEMPFFLYPLKTGKPFFTPKDNPAKYDFRILQNRTDWNEFDTLRAYVNLLIRKTEYSNSQIIEIVRAINEELLQPKKWSELESSFCNEQNLEELRKKTKCDKTKGEGKVFLDDVARGIVEAEKDNLCLIGGVIHIRLSNNLYADDRNELYKLISKYQNHLTQQQKEEVLRAMIQTHDIQLENRELSPAYLIPFKNNVYNIHDNKFLDYSSEMVFTHKIPFEYKQDAKETEQVNKWLNSISYYDEKRRASIEEVLGYPFYRSNKLLRGKMILTVGDSHAGKSTLQDILKFLLTGRIDTGLKDVVSTLKIENFEDRFAKCQLFNKWLNIGDDVSTGQIRKNNTLKSVISGDEIEAEYKGRDMFSFRPFCKLIFSTNQIPLIADEGGGMSARIHIINFKNCYLAENSPDRIMHPDAEKIDIHLVEEITGNQENIDYLIRLAVEGLKRLIENEAFTLPDEERNTLNELRQNFNPLLMWIEEQGFNDVERRAYFMDKSCNEVRQFFLLWSKEHSLEKISENITPSKFSREICKKFGLETKAKRKNDAFNGCSVVKCFSL